MTRVVITINTDGSAFGDEPEYEVKRILKELGADIGNSGLHEKSILDINGNKVGNLNIQDF